MRNAQNWTLNWGWWFGIRVRAHASLLVVGLLSMYLTYLTGRTAATDEPWRYPLYGLMWIAILCASVIMHEAGHVLATLRLGGSVDTVVLGPLGGLHPYNVPHESHREVLVALSGPLVNLLISMSTAAALLMDEAKVHELFLQPLYPVGLLEGTEVVVALKMAFWINWVLLLVNLLPAAPLDGGRALRSVLWPATGYRLAVRVVSRSGMLIALGLCFLAWWASPPGEYRVVPLWAPTVLMAIYLYFCARQELDRLEDQDDDDQLFGYDFSQGYTSLDRPHSMRRPRGGFVRRWFRERRELKERRLRDLEQEEERRVDSVLVRVKELGIDAISPEERALLQRVSARYRSRLQS